MKSITHKGTEQIHQLPHTGERLPSDTEKYLFAFRFDGNTNRLHNLPNAFRRKQIRPCRRPFSIAQSPVHSFIKVLLSIDHLSRFAIMMDSVLQYQNRSTSSAAMTAVMGQDHWSRRLLGPLLVLGCVLLVSFDFTSLSHDKHLARDNSVYVPGTCRWLFILRSHGPRFPPTSLFPTVPHLTCLPITFRPT